jgi:DNA-binding CsgD family transcriptional regulator
MENELLENINRNLEVIIGLLLRSLPDSEAASLRDRILMLTAMGMRPNEIARALGKSANHVNKELSIGRSTEQKRGKTKK